MRKLSAVIRTIGTRLITKKFPIWNKNIIKKMRMIMTSMVNNMMITRKTMMMAIIMIETMIKKICSRESTRRRQRLEVFETRRWSLEGKRGGSESVLINVDGDGVSCLGEKGKVNIDVAVITRH